MEQSEITDLLVAEIPSIVWRTLKLALDFKVWGLEHRIISGAAVTLVLMCEQLCISLSASLLKIS